MTAPFGQKLQLGIGILLLLAAGLLAAACGDDDEASDVADFVMVRSEVYPQLEAYYAAKAAAWLERRASADEQGP